VASTSTSGSTGFETGAERLDLRILVAADEADHAFLGFERGGRAHEERSLLDREGDRHDVAQARPGRVEHDPRRVRVGVDELRRQELRGREPEHHELGLLAHAVECGSCIGDRFPDLDRLDM
jgi:hypothetical protein